MIGGFAVSDLTAGALLGVCVILILTGRIVPRSVLKDKDREAQQWHAAFTVEREARMEADFQARELISLAQSTHKLVFGTSLPTPSLEENSDVSQVESP